MGEGRRKGAGDNKQTHAHTHTHTATQTSWVQRQPELKCVCWASSGSSSRATAAAPLVDIVALVSPHSGLKSITIIIYYVFEIIVYNRILNIVQILSNLRIKSKILSEVRTKIDMLEKNLPLK